MSHNAETFISNDYYDILEQPMSLHMVDLYL